MLAVPVCLNMLGGFQLAADFRQALALVQIVEVCSRSCGESWKDKPPVNCLSCFLGFAAPRLVIVSTNEQELVGKLATHHVRYNGHILRRKRHIHRILAGKVNAGPGGVALAQGEGFFRLALNDTMPTMNFAACKEAFFSIRRNALQALHLTLCISDGNEQRACPVLPYASQCGNALAQQIRMLRRTRLCGVQLILGFLCRRCLPLGELSVALLAYGRLPLLQCLFFC